MRVNPFTPEQESWWLLPEQKLPEDVPDKKALALDRLWQSIPQWTPHPLEDYEEP